MKKMLLSLSILCALPLFFACQSTKVDLSAYSPVAIMTVYSNSSVPWYESHSASNADKSQMTNDGLLMNTVNRVLGKANPETDTAQARIDEASALISARLCECGITVIDPSTLKNCAAYKNTGKKVLDFLGNTLPASGYDVLTMSNKHVNQAMCKESGAKAVLYVNFRFQKAMVKSGARNNAVAARGAMQVVAANADGKKLFNREYTAVSSASTPLVKTSSWDKEAVCNAFPEVIERVVSDFLLDYAPFVNADLPPVTAAPTAIKLPARHAADASTQAQNADGTQDNAEFPQESANASENAVLLEKRSTAKKLLERGMTAEEAAEITGLPVEQIKALE